MPQMSFENTYRLRSQLLRSASVMSSSAPACTRLAPRRTISLIAIGGWQVGGIDCGCVGSFGNDALYGMRLLAAEGELYARLCGSLTRTGLGDKRVVYQLDCPQAVAVL